MKSKRKSSKKWDFDNVCQDHDRLIWFSYSLFYLAASIKQDQVTNGVKTRSANEHKGIEYLCSSHGIPKEM